MGGGLSAATDNAGEGGWMTLARRRVACRQHGGRAGWLGTDTQSDREGALAERTLRRSLDPRAHGFRNVRGACRRCVCMYVCTCMREGWTSFRCQVARLRAASALSTAQRRRRRRRSLNRLAISTKRPRQHRTRDAHTRWGCAERHPLVAGRLGF